LQNNKFVDMPLSKEYIITLLKTPKIGQVSAKAINSNLSFKITSVNELYDLIVDTKQNNSKIPLPDLKDLMHANEQAQQLMEECERKNISIVSVNDPAYPIKLMRLSDNPIITYTKGAVSTLNAHLTAAVIGTREPSPFGLKAGRRVSGILGRNGFTIISGLAIGCDTAGHQGALDVSAPTVAVLASGVNIIYPKENKYLADQILDTGGALFSEYEPNFTAQRSSFVERDRLQSGLSDGLIVVETDIKGGTMHTVGFAKKMNIPIGCISNHPESLRDFDKIRGNKMLINEGAYPIGNPEQIFTFIKRMNPNATEFISDEKNKENSLKTESNPEALANQSPQIPKLGSQEPLLIETPIKAKEILDLAESGEKQTDQQSLLEEMGTLKNLVIKLLDQQQEMKIMMNNLLLQLQTKEKPVKEKKAEKTQTKLL